MKNDFEQQSPSESAVKHEIHSCPVCTMADELNLLCSVDGYDILTCTACGADHVFPVPDERALKAYYDRQEWFDGGEAGGYSDYDAQTEWSIDLVESVLHAFSDRPGLSVLDVGCGYGTHLALAAKRGWKCFGVELSDHARAVAVDRLGKSAFLVESASDLIPHEFDLILILDTIEHLASPYPLLFQLFSIGAITPKTELVITTPNAGSVEARSDPAGWAYRHPPSHLVYYSSESLQKLLHRLRFTDISVRGMHGTTAEASVETCSGLLVKATGSDFTEFMRERYVPGTWSKVAEYEHLPRYVLARTFAKDRQVLDFGCGTGYGTAMLAETSAGAIGLDIDSTALAWARESHRAPQLSFYQSDDLGASLASASVDVVTCFEMIEHVDYATQQAAISSIGRLLRDDGLLLISTPNPEVTKLYGENPYHIREMTEAEFLDLLGAEFPYIRMYRQLVRNSIAFATSEDHSSLKLDSMARATQSSPVAPIAFIAVCSRRPLSEVPNLVVFDDDVDLVENFLSIAKKLNEARLLAYSSQEEALQMQLKFHAAEKRANSQNTAVAASDEAIAAQAAAIGSLTAALASKDEALQQTQAAATGSLNAALASKDEALQTQAAKIDSLTAALASKDQALQTQAAEIDSLTAALASEDEALQTQAAAIGSLTAALASEDEALQTKAAEIHALNSLLRAKEASVTDLEGSRILLQSVKAELLQRDATLSALRKSKVFRLRELVLHQPWSVRKLLHIAYLLGAMATPRRLRTAAGPYVARCRRLVAGSPAIAAPAAHSESTPYVVKQSPVTKSDAPRIAHVIANFMTGGSSRLVVDLIEHLGKDYRQSVITSYIPDPPAYIGLEIEECRFPEDSRPFVDYFERTKPDLVHVHYWGDCDEPWYAKAIQAAENLGLPVVENVNTPVAPYLSPAVVRYIYVSDYVRRVFGAGDSKHITIYPGSDFSHFFRAQEEALPENCVGMVYRLEHDKLNEQSIAPFISIALRRPRTRILIVGGGSLLQPFQDAVATAGVTDCFEFTGYVSYDELPELYRRMTLFVAPVWKESFGQVSSFAMNMRIPVIGYDVGAISEIMAVPDLVAPPGDAEKLADIAIELLDTPERLERVGRAQQEWAQTHFSVQAMVRSVAAVYSQLRDK